MNFDEKFRSYFSCSFEKSFFSPGRVNLIGEHIDYNGGNVFPCAINLGTYGYVKLRDDNRFRVISLNFEEEGIFEFNSESLDYSINDGWSNYVKGMIKFLYPKSVGFDLMVWGNIPNGAGLSSSASLEMLVGYILRDINKLDCDDLDIIKLGVKVENEFIGVSSGIMDQFAVMKGKKAHAISLNTNTLDYSYAPLQLKGYTLLIMNTNKRRELSDSKYNERRKECEEVLNILQQGNYKKYLCDYSMSELNELKKDMSKVLYKRARHAITEQKRTVDAKRLLEENDLVGFGKLMNASHDSLKDDYEVTGEELDTIVSLARAHSSVLGARVTGAGFGGCAIALVADKSLDYVIEAVGNGYLEKIGYEADFYPVKPSEGVLQIT